MTTKTNANSRKRATQRNIGAIRHIEIMAHMYLGYCRDIWVGAIIGITLLSIVAIITIGLLLHSGTLTVQHIQYITGDSYYVLSVHGNELASYQVTGNWIQQFISIVWGVFVQIVQSIGNLFS